MDYNKYYKTNKNVFGKEPERILSAYCHLISREIPILDIGAGQGRNSIYLSKLGYKVDAIDTSEFSIRMLEKIKEKEKLELNTFCTDYKNFSGKKFYSAILVFGLVQILDWDGINLLREKISGWMKPGSLLFITSFTTSDESYCRISKSSKIIGKNSYLRKDGEKRTYFEPEEIKNLFQKYKVLHYWEGLGPEHRHGNSPVERHSMVEAVFQI